uniref:DNA polymerase delta subunit 3 n=1 Tax=Heterosigma akashiwo TaxID=2829 RepID=A0A7S3XRJ7_HETAK
MSNDAELEALQKEILSIKFDARNVSKQRRQKDGKSQKSQEGNPFLNTKNYKAPSIFEAFGITPLAKPNKPAQPPTVGSSGAQASNPNGVDFRTIASGEDDDVEQQIAVDNSVSDKGPSSEAPGSSANKDAADVSYLEQKELLEMLATSSCEKTASVVPLSLSAQLGGRKRESREEVCNNGDEVTPAVEVPPPHSINPFKKSKQTNNIAATLPKSIKNGGSTIIRNKDFVAAAGTPSIAVASASPARTSKDDSMIMKSGKRRLSQNQLPTTSKGKRVQKKARPPGGSINGKKGGAGMATLHQFFNASKS